MRSSFMLPLVFLGLGGCVATQYPSNAQQVSTVVTPAPDGEGGSGPRVTTTYVAPAAPVTTTTTYVTPVPATTYVAPTPVVSDTVSVPVTTYVAPAQATTTTTYMTAPPTTHYVVPTSVSTSLPDATQ